MAEYMLHQEHIRQSDAALAHARASATWLADIRQSRFC
jgi:hypothetical protein